MHLVSNALKIKSDKSIKKWWIKIRNEKFWRYAPTKQKKEKKFLSKKEKEKKGKKGKKEKKDKKQMK